MEIELGKARVKIMEGEEQKLEEMANQEHLGNKLSWECNFLRNISIICLRIVVGFKVHLLQKVKNVIQNQELRKKVMLKVKKVLRTWFANFSGNKGLKLKW